MLACFLLTSFAGWAQAGSYDQFFIALQRDDVRTLERLQRLGFDLNAPSPELEPPLLLALNLGSLRAAQFLMQQPEVDVNARNQADENALMIASLRGHLELVQALIERRAQVNKPGWTPLHYAAAYDGPQALPITRWLLEHHALIDAESPNRTTPLMMAAQYGYSEVVRLLLEEGADPLVRNEQGLTAIDFAQRAQRDAVVQLIASTIRRAQPAGTW